MNQLCAVQNYNIPFVGKAVPIYFIDRDMNFEKRSSAHKASKELQVATPSILKCLSGKGKHAGDYCFVRADEVETIKDDGTVEIDIEKIRKIYEVAEIARVEGLNVCKKSVYAMDREQNLLHFESVTDASNNLGINRTNIVGCLSGNKNSAGGYVFFEANDIESEDENGNKVVDNKKLQKAVQRMIEVFLNPYIAEKIPIYAICADETYKKFDTLADAVRELKISYKTIATRLSQPKPYGGFCFVRADEIEKVNEDGTVQIDEEKIKQLSKIAKDGLEKDDSIRGKAVYAIKIEDLTYEKFEKSAHAAKKLGISPANLSACLAGRKKNTSGYAFVPASKIEVEDENGEFRIDENKLKEVLDKIKESPSAFKTPKKEKISNRTKTESSEPIESGELLESIEGKKTNSTETNAEIVEEMPKEPQTASKENVEDEGLQTSIKNEPTKEKQRIMLDEIAHKSKETPDTPVIYGAMMPESEEHEETKSSTTDDSKEKTFEYKKEDKLLKEPLYEERLPETRPETKTVISITPQQEGKKTSKKAVYTENDNLCDLRESFDFNHVSGIVKQGKTSSAEKKENPKTEDATLKQEKTTPRRKYRTTSKYKKLGRIYAVNLKGDDMEFPDFDTAVRELNIDPKTLHDAIRGKIKAVNGLVISCDLDE